MLLFAMDVKLLELLVLGFECDNNFFHHLDLSGDSFVLALNSEMLGELGFKVFVLLSNLLPIGLQLFDVTLSIEQLPIQIVVSIFGSSELFLHAHAHLAWLAAVDVHILRILSASPGV